MPSFLVEDFNTPSKMVDRCYGGANINALMGAGGWCASAASLCRLVASIDGNPGSSRCSHIIKREPDDST